MTDRPEWANEIDQAGDKAPETLLSRYGRRAMMLGAAATGAGVAASLVGGGMAEAAPDSSPPVLLGKSNTTGATTRVISRTGTGLSGHAASASQSGVAGYDTSRTRKGFGVYGQSVNGVGVNGISKTNNGVAGNASAVGFSGVAGIDNTFTRGTPELPTQGVYGQSNVNNGVTGVSFGGTGIAGHCKTPGFAGVEAVDAATKSGAYGLKAVSAHGTALFGTTTNGLGLHVDGKAKFRYSGVVFISPGQKTKTVSAPGLTSSDLVLATLQVAENGVYIEAAVPGSGSFTVTLSKAPSNELHFGWFAIAS